MRQCRPSLLITLTFLLLSPRFASGNDSTSISHSLPRIVLDDAVIFLQDGALFVTAPLRFTGREWLTAAGVVGGSVALMAADGDLKQGIGRDTESTRNRDFWDIPTEYGRVEYANVFAVATYLTGLFAGSDDLRITGRLLFESLSFAGGSVMIVRFLAGRSRPYGENSPWDFNGFQWRNRYQSFPSGHTTVAFAFSTVMAERLDSPWARIGFYGVASLTAFARVYNNQHWVSDVVAGGALGLAAGLHVTSREKEREKGREDRSTGLEIRPALNGIRVVYWLR